MTDEPSFAAAFLDETRSMLNGVDVASVEAVAGHAGLPRDQRA